jgi:hypothetical protein
MRLSLFFAELKRRKVFKVAAVYGATSFLLLQIADIVFPALGLPQWTITLVVASIVIAFPLVLAMSWIFESTPDGLRRTAPAEAAELEALVAQPRPPRARLADQDPSLILISALFEFNPLRKDPRFIRLIQQLGVANGIQP